MNEPLNSIFKYLFLDIETTPQNRDFFDMNEKWRSLFIEKNAKIISENNDIALCYNERAGILAEFGKIICISVGYAYKNDAGEICLKIKNIYGHDEKKILLDFTESAQKFEKKIPDFYFAGHNIKEFDIPYICRRMLVNALPRPAFLPAYATKPWEARMIDTLHWWRFGDYKNYISLDLLANTLNVPTSKTDIKGSDVRNVYYEENDPERIARYCARDVAVVANLIMRFYNLSLLKNENIHIS